MSGFDSCCHAYASVSASDAKGRLAEPSYHHLIMPYTNPKRLSETNTNCLQGMH
jgi:hypothetical protein